MAHYTNIIKNPARIMADKSISKSFKGILRIAHILDGDTSDDSNKLSQLFYRNFRAMENRKLVNIDGKPDKENVTGYPKAYPYGLDETNPIARYKSDDPFINAKLPICDSLGNYVNINIGLNGIVFGSDENIGKAYTEKVSLDSGELCDKYFPVLKARGLVLGMTEIKKTSEKKLRNKNSKIVISDSDANNEAKLIIDNGTIPDKENRLRTIYTAEPGSYTENWGMVYQQENWGRESFNADKTIDCKAGMVDLVEYVKERIDKYIGSNTIPVPAGSIIWEYVSLWNYYAKADDGFGDEFAGHRPRMAQPANLSSSENINYPFKNTLLSDGLTLKTNKLLGRNSKDGKSSFKEVLPLYKRDYVLCDGGKYTIMPCKTSTYTNKNAVFDRLINLFLSIGYYYTDIESKNSFMPCVAEKDSSGAILRYRYILNDYTDLSKMVYVKQSQESIAKFTSVYKKAEPVICPAWVLINQHKDKNNQDLFWSNDITTMVAYRILTEITDTSVFAAGHESVENYLKTGYKNGPVLIPSQYAYYGINKDGKNSNDPNYCNTVTYTIGEKTAYTDKSGNPVTKFNFEIGKEIIDFNSTIVIPVYDGDLKDFEPYGFNVKLVECPLWQHPAVQAFIDLLILGGSGGTNRWIEATAQYNFNVPNFNMTYSKELTSSSGVKYSNTGTNGIGGFMGTCGYTWISSGYAGAKSFDYTCNAKEGSVPHRHYIFQGVAYESGAGDVEYTPIADLEGFQYNNGPSYVTSCGSENMPCYYFCQNTSPTGAIDSGSNFLTYNTYSYLINMLPVTMSDKYDPKRYFCRVATVGDKGNIMMYNKEDFFESRDTLYAPGVLEPNRCITSTPVSWSGSRSPETIYNKEQANKYDGGYIDFFSPECVYMVPLIKL